MNELTATATMPAPATRDLRAFDENARAVVDEVVSFWPNDGSKAVLRREMSFTERAILHDRQRIIHGLLRPLSSEDRKVAARVIAAMFLGFPNMRQGDPQATVAAYVIAMSGFPLFAIVEACEDVSQRRVGDINPDFAPTAPRMCELATRHLVPLSGELLVIEKTIVAKVHEKVISPEERERIKTGLRELADAMIVRDKIQRQQHLIHQAVVLTEASTKMILDEY